ncbi:capsule biosynthesis protein [Marinibacterium profundimaris]|uniref:capsule biosynthesis protein n=1 Tax=Marinibacterium profundimaris TaxID=1679460 RepID=UPI001E4D2DD6|nr:capsule biosynthesis protein [Marinibacterium profundimaris]
MTASSSADPKRAAQTGAEDPGTQTDQDAQRFRQSDDTETGETERDETDAGTDAGTDGEIDPETGEPKPGSLAARRAAAQAVRAEAEAALKARKEARAIAETQKAERELARAEAEANKQAAIDNAAPPVHRARAKRRHYMMVTSFIFLVLLPAALSAWYLWERATDQYASYVGFSVRTEEQGPSIEGLFGVSDLSGSSSSDTDILYEFLQSQQLVSAVDKDLGIRAMWSRPGVEKDPIFAYNGPGTIEDLTAHWGKKVKIYYDSNSGLIQLRVLAFDPDEAQAIAEAIYEESSAMINRLSAIAREDAISYARDELEEAQEQLREARIELQAFRNRTQIVDPTIQSQSQSGLIGALETELAQAQIERQLLADTARENDPRVTQIDRRIEAIEKQIAAERSVIGLEGADQSATVADLVGQYEALAADLQFAQEAYTAARVAFDSARNEARRQSRYLAAHVPPTKAERAEYPDRVSTLTVIVLFLFVAWAFLVLVAYALRDRR